MLTLIEQIDRRQRPGGLGGHRHHHPPQPPNQRLDAGRVEHIGVVFDTKDQFETRLSLHRQRIVVVFTAGGLGDGQIMIARQRGSVDRVAFVHKQGVKQLIAPADAVDLAQPQMLVLQGIVVGFLQLIEQVSGASHRRDPCPHRHRIDEQAHHRIRAGHLSWPTRDHRAKNNITLTGQPHQQPRESALQHHVDSGVTRAGHLPQPPRNPLGHPKRSHTPAPQPQPIRRAHQCGSVKTGQHLTPRRARRIAIPTSQPSNKTAIRRGRRQPLPVIASKHLRSRIGNDQPSITM